MNKRTDKGRNLPLEETVRGAKDDVGCEWSVCVRKQQPLEC